MYGLILLTTLIHLIDTLAYSVRLNAVKSGKFALSTSFFNLFVLLARTANMFQAPLIGALVGLSIKNNYDPIVEIRWVVFSATVGTILGTLLIPTFLKIFAKGVERLEDTGSIPLLAVQALQIESVKRIVKTTTAPKKGMLKRLRYREIPKRLLLLHVLITAISTIGVISAFYATFFVSEEYILAASASSGIINGVATILLTLLVDPKSAIITDQAMNGNRPYGDVKALVVTLIATKLIGTLLAQALIVPAALIIAAFYQ